MSCDECGNKPSKGLNESVDLCPFNRMADGRAFTDYKSKCQKVTELNSYDERMFLIDNANDIRKSSMARYVCSKCANKENTSKSTVLPEKYEQICDKNSCKFVLKNKDGLGLGRK